MYFNDGTFQVAAEPMWKKYDGEKMQPLVVADGHGPWAVRYIWCKHRENNDEFVSNYFVASGNTKEAGLNLRKRTAYMQEHWDPHNALINTSRDNGNLVWRVKVHNPLANSIDYIEVWRSPEVLATSFGYITAGAELKVNNTTVRTAENQQTLRNGLYENGFEIQRWVDKNTNWPMVSPQLAMYWYWNFVKRHYRKDNCRVNTMWRLELNPWRGVYPEPHADINQLINDLKPKGKL